MPEFNRIGQKVELKDYLIKNGSQNPDGHVTEESML